MTQHRVLFEGLLAATENPEQTMAIILDAKDQDDATARLVEAYGIHPVAAEFVTDQQLRRWYRGERDRIREQMLERLRQLDAAE